jgi:excinuclease ABC subunit C
MTIEEYKKAKLPDTPGVYFFKDSAGNILYIGKATSLRDRVRSYFMPDLINTRGRFILDMVTLAKTIDFVQTDSVLEALLLEANLIKQHQPKYNTDEKDNKSFNYVIFTDEDFPKVMTIRGRTLFKSLGQSDSSVFTQQAGAYALQNLTDARALKKLVDQKPAKYVFGPFPHGGQLKEALKIIRRIFPYSDAKCVPYEEQIKQGRKPRPCFNRQIGLCPGVCTGEISREDYSEQIQNLRLFFEGKKKTLLKNLEKQMKEHAEKQEFERAAEMRRTIFALNHIQDIALLKSEKKLDESAGGEFKTNDKAYRIEAYDVAHSSGTSVVGVMTVVEDGEVNKSQYRKFRIRINPGVNDTGALKEILRRRLGHLEWPLPNLIAVDGGKAQLNAGTEIINKLGFTTINLVAVIKDERHKPKEILGSFDVSPGLGRAVLLANSEAHRFALAYHRKKRDKII